MSNHLFVKIINPNSKYYQRIFAVVKNNEDAIKGYHVQIGHATMFFGNKEVEPFYRQEEEPASVSEILRDSIILK